MDRRVFLARLGFGTVSAAAAVCTFDIEKLLWVPGERMIVVMPPDLIGVNRLIPPNVFLREFADILKKNIKYSAKFDADYERTFAAFGA